MPTLLLSDDQPSGMWVYSAIGTSNMKLIILSSWADKGKRRGAEGGPGS